MIVYCCRLLPPLGPTNDDNISCPQELSGLPEARQKDLVFGETGIIVNQAADETDNSIPPATYKFRLYSGKVRMHVDGGGPGIHFYFCVSFLSQDQVVAARQK